MTRVDFYVLERGGQEARRRLVCRLVEKAYQQGHRIYIHTGDAAEAARLDELLWTFNDGGFLPHALLHGTADPHTPIHIGHQEPPAELDDVLVNLDAQVPLFFSRFQRVAEVLDDEPQCRAQGRERFRFYRDRGYPLDSHSIATA